MSNDFFEEREIKKENKAKKVITKENTSSNNIDNDNYPDVVILSILFSWLGLLIYAFNIGSNKLVARKALKFSLISIGIKAAISFLVFIIMMLAEVSYYY